MTDQSPIYTTYEEWHDFIEIRCKIELTPAYIGERLIELQDHGHSKTKEFVKLYGTDHLQQIISYFYQAAKDLPRELS